MIGRIRRVEEKEGKYVRRVRKGRGKEEEYDC
jgi:hypothetical protein